MIKTVCCHGRGGELVIGLWGAGAECTAAQLGLLQLPRTII